MNEGLELDVVKPDPGESLELLDWPAIVRDVERGYERCRIKYGWPKNEFMTRMKMGIRESLARRKYLIT